MTRSRPTPSGYRSRSSAVSEKIQAVFDNLSPRQHHLAQYFIDHEEAIAFTSANEIGKLSGVSAATVVRFARVLGYEGFTDLQEDVRSTLLENRTASQGLEERINAGGFNGDIAAFIAEVNTRNIKETMDQVSPIVLSDAVNAILNAERVCVFGGGMSAAAAMMAEHSLLMLGIPVRAIVNGGLSQTLEISKLTDRDVVVAISIWRYLRDTVDAARYARALGATTIALTDSPVSAVARVADLVFVAATERAAHSRSLTGIMSLIDLINATIISRRPRESMQALKRIEDSYIQQDRLVQE
jgi:DNA-binding MurR/RpiR family transcriptional regulator